MPPPSGFERGQDHRERDFGARLAARPRGRTPRGCAPCRRAGRGRRSVIGIVAAKWLASLAPPRRAATIAAPERSLARSSSGAVASSDCMPGQRRISSACSVAPPTSAGMCVEHALDRVEVVGAQVAEELAGAGDDVERVAGADHGRHRGQVRGTVRVVLRRDGLRGGGEREQRVAAAVRRASPSGRCGPCAGDVDRARGLAPHDDALVVAGELAGLEAQAGVEAREALDVAEVGGPPLLVADEQQRELARSAPGASAKARSAPMARMSPPFMSTRARAEQLLADVLERPVLRRGRRRCRRGRAAARGRCRCRGVRATRSSAWPGEEHGTRSIVASSGAQRRAHGGALVRPVHVAGRRGHGDQRLELARRSSGDLRRRLLDPRIHPRAG